MKVFHTDYARLGLWSHTDLAYIRQDSALLPFLAYVPNQTTFQEIMQQRHKFPVDRLLLLNTLKKQYQKLGMSLPVEDEILLDENTFTVTTSHQPTLFTGPLFHIYKIASTIHLAKDISTANPGHVVLPVFIVSGEDHDWAEMNHFNLFGKKFEWARTASGAIGRLSTDGLAELVSSLRALFENSPSGPVLMDLLESCLHKADSYSDFHQLLIHGLFHDHGLIVLNMDDVDLKRAFIPWMEKEIREQFSCSLIPSTQAALEKSGFKPQAYCRKINLFYLHDQIRERIEPLEGNLVLVDSGIRKTVDDFVAELHDHPDRFSPNVILRPLYQEAIFPNLAFIGGGGEIAYWLERKSQFEAAGIHFPMLIRRNSLMMIDAATSTQLRKAGFTWEDFLPDYNSIVKTYLNRHSHTDLHFEKELEMIRQAHQLLAEKAEKLDPTLAKAILAEETKQVKQFEQLGSRLLRTEKQLQETNLKRIRKWKDKLFPEGGLQERHENFMSFYATYGSAWLNSLIELCDPMDRTFTVVELEG